MSISKGRAARRSDRYGLRRRDDDGDARPERPPSLAEHVCRVIREDILTGRQPAGARLTEAIVMERTGVSRTPVREGLRMLEGEGLVITYRSRGTFVTYRLTPDEAKLLYDVRLVLEPHLARLGAERMTPEVLASVEDVLARFVEALDAAEAREAGQLDADFHLDHLRGRRAASCSASCAATGPGSSWSCPSASTTPRSRAASWTSTSRSSRRSRRATPTWWSSG